MDGEDLLPADLVPLGRLFQSNIDDANFVGDVNAARARLDALRSARAALESSSRRKHEVEVHCARLKQLGLQHRIAELSTPAGKDAEATAAAGGEFQIAPIC